MNIAYVTSDGENVLAPGIAAPMSRGEAEALGFEVRRVAFAYSSGGRDRVRYADLNTGSQTQALADGFIIEPMPQSMRAAIEREAKPKRQKALADARDAAAAIKLNVDPNNAPADAAATLTWAEEISASDEAQLRPDALAALLEIHSEESISAPLAVAMISALPIEHYHVNQTTEDTMTTLNATAALTRAAELRASALAVRGDAKSLTESKRINAALHQHRSMGVEIVPALRDAGVDLAPIAAAAKSAA